MSCSLPTYQEWFETAVGQDLLAMEITALEKILPQFFGYHLAQIGEAGGKCLFAASRIPHRFILGLSGKKNREAHLQAEAAALPFAADSLDVIILPHILEFEEHPHQVLREVERALIADGYLIVLGFNPFSLWGLRRWSSIRRPPPWSGKWISLLRLKDWLALLGFELIEQQSFLFSLSFQRQNFLKLEQFSKRWLPGDTYLLVAKKRRIPLMPIRPCWKYEPLGAVEPTARSKLENRD